MEVGQRAYSLVWYRPATEPTQLQQLLTDADGIHHAQGIPPHKVSWRETARMREDARRLLAPQFAEMLEKTAQPFLQPIFDLSTPSLHRGPVALLGDAAFVARPHVGMGVTKAMQDALTLADAISLHGATHFALQAYSEQRVKPGQQVLERSRQLGAYLQTCGTSANHTPSRDAQAVLRDTATDPEAPQSAISTITA
jgi:2-polyprenyl-6-methoxyphenol hydroxylase-like FAD-dependent oxidoreductase